MIDLATKYQPADVEPRVADKWNDQKAFAADPASDAPPYCIVIPPPNVTAALHMGHALNNTLQDVLIRWRRMCGDNAVWIPGTDHAGIATQTVVDKRLQAEGKPALKDYKRMQADGQDGRDQFVAKVQAWKDEYEKRITDQLKAMGCSCDWDRQRFTMDDTCARAVREAFFRLFKDGLIYRGKRLVNWDPATQTALADDEVEMRDVDGHFWYMKYPVVEPDGSGGWEKTGEYVTVATTRPETMLGDTAVAVNPNDAPRAKFIRKYCMLPIVNRPIEIIPDDYVVVPDPDSADEKAKFASGFLKVTPAHDPNDWEIGQRHDLDIINVMAPDGTISDQHGWPAEDIARADQDAVPLGLDRYEAREAIVDWFRRNKLLEEVRPYTHAVGHSYRSHVPIEPYLSDQWYVKVTDPRLAGAALRALSPDEPATSPDRKGGGAYENQPTPPTSPPPKTDKGGGTYENHESPEPTTPAPHHPCLITFTTYGTWLHGDVRGSVEAPNNLPATPIDQPNAALANHEHNQLKSPPLTFNTAQRRNVRDTIQEVCRHRRWHLHACNVLTNHVHVVVAADRPPERVMNDFKSYATRRMVQADLLQQGREVWTRHGSTRYLNEEASVTAACRYVLEEQGDDNVAVADNEVETGGSVRGNPLPHGRGSLRTPPVNHADWENQLRFYPPRYAKTFRAWHENIRDWCISRQLWWGHRIPVWTITFKRLKTPVDPTEKLCEYLAKCGIEKQDYHLYQDNRLIEGHCPYYLCSRDPRADKALQLLVPILQHRSTSDVDQVRLYKKENDALREAFGDSAFKSSIRLKAPIRSCSQDPDVLDTWFSSALWPFSTLGWPGETAEMKTWNPGSVLCTAREIITLWVSRMVMTNLYFLDRLPFYDVFIHAMIQDGQGRKMSKSLGNGVDPLDIIHSHGSDAMRYTLASMTTTTQDVRMPVAKDPETGRNTSEKFDLGRNFANKLWNAVRFALVRLEEAKEQPTSDANTDEGLTLADRWILSRLARTVRDADAALQNYEFSHYAQGLYDFFWRDLCDWYIEAIKPTVGTNPGQQTVLALCIDASLRLLHPVMPFITEELWTHLNAVAPDRDDHAPDGVLLPPSELLIRAPWPIVSDALIYDDVEADFALVQELVGAMRQVRTTHKVPPRKQVDFSAQAPADDAKRIAAVAPLIETLANVQTTDLGPDVEKPADAASAICGPTHLYLHGLVDADAERERLSKRLEEVNKSIGALKGRLANKKYVEKAPAHLVEETKGQLAAAEQEHGSLKEQLAAL